MANRTKLTPARVNTFLAEIRRHNNVTQAAKKIRLSRGYMYQYRDAEENAVFKRRWQEAEDEFLDKCEAECVRRAYSGYDEPVYYQGEEVGYVRKYSDRLLMFHLRAKRAEFQEKHHHHLSDPDGNPLFQAFQEAARTDG